MISLTFLPFRHHTSFTHRQLYRFKERVRTTTPFAKRKRRIMCKSSPLSNLPLALSLSLSLFPMLIGTCLSVRIMALNLNILPIKMNYVCDMFFCFIRKMREKIKRSSRREIDKAKFYYMEEKFPAPGILKGNKVRR